MLLKIRDKLKEKSGISMINVLAAFAVFLLTILMFSQAVNLSLRLFEKSEDIRRSTESDFASFYQHTEYTKNDGRLGEEDANFTFTDQNGGNFVLNSHSGEYKPTGSERSIFYFGQRKNP